MKSVLLILLLAGGSPTWAATCATTMSVQEKERALEKARDLLIDQAATIENEFAEVLPTVEPSLKPAMTDLQTKFNTLVQRIFEPGLIDTAAVEHSLRKLQTLLRAIAAIAYADHLEDILNGLSPRPDFNYAVDRPGGHVHILRFTPAFLADFEDMEAEFKGRFLRAVLHGFVGPHSGSGVVRLRDLHKDMVEVKVIGSATRILGCFDSGSLTLRKMIKKRNEGKRLAGFAGVCD